MNRTSVTIVVLCIAICVVAVTFSVTYISDDGEEFSITYELNGGENDPSNPSSYISGNGTTLKSPVKDGYVFSGWYLDEDLTEYFEGITSETTGDLVLYASWSDTLDGHGFVMEVSGDVRDGMFSTYRISGTMTYRYLYYDGENDRYYINRTTDLTYQYRFSSYESHDSKDFWNDEDDDDYSIEQSQNETISTVNGDKDCEVYIIRYANGSAEKQWIGDGWIPYRIVYESTGIFSSSSIEYVFQKELEFIPDVRCEVIAYEDAGITVTGNGTYNPGDRVTLTASGNGFVGWYDESGNKLSSDRQYSTKVGGTDIILYALNDKDPDITSITKQTTEIGSDRDIMSPIWSIVQNGEVIATYDTASLSHTFTRAGDYVVLLDATVDDEPYHAVRNLEVSGVTDLTFTWKYSGKTYSTNLGIDYDDYRYYRDLTPVSERHQESSHVKDKQFVTYSDKYVIELASVLGEMSAGMTDIQRMNFILAFVQYIEYQSDDVFMGYEEYWKYPVETLFDQGGDCEDTSILLSAIAEAMGYNTCLLLFPGHMAMGVDLGDGVGSFVSYGNHKFSYCETTATGYSVGDKPSSVTNSATVVPICSNDKI